MKTIHRTLEKILHDTMTINHDTSMKYLDDLLAEVESITTSFEFPETEKNQLAFVIKGHMHHIAAHAFIDEQYEKGGN